MGNPLTDAATERRFRLWYGPIARKLKLDPDPDAPEHFYDYRAFHRDMESGANLKPPSEAGGHWDSTYKLPGNPREYLTDPLSSKVFKTETGQYLDGAEVPEQRMQWLNDHADQTPDMPGFDPEKAKALARVGVLLRTK